MMSRSSRAWGPKWGLPFQVQLGSIVPTLRDEQIYDDRSAADYLE